jgi:hypothetical protein
MLRSKTFQIDKAVKRLNVNPLQIWKQEPIKQSPNPNFSFAIPNYED